MKSKAFQPEIRFSDIDVMGHVNNATYLTYFEEARVHFFREIVGLNWDWNLQGIIIARSEIDYKSPIKFNDKISIFVEPIHVGDSSFTLAYEVARTSDPAGICATGRTVQVCMDYKSGKKAMVPEKWRNTFQKLMEK